MSEVTHSDTQAQKSQLWTIIEKQRVIIQELQQALLEMTAERDSLLLKQKEEQPTLPPRSPYRTPKEEGEIPATENNSQQKSSSSSSSSNSINNNSNDNNSLGHLMIQLVNSKLIKTEKGKETPLFLLSVLDKKTNKELWRISKLYTDILTLDSALDSVSNKKISSKYGKLLTDKSYFASTTSPAKMELRKIIVEEYLKYVMSLPLIDTTPIYSFIRSNIIDTNTKKETKSGQKEGYLTKRGKNFGGWKIRYYILDGPILKYYETKEGQLLGTILLPEAQIGKQTSNEDQSNPFLNAFIILEPKKSAPHGIHRHILCATSELERNEWVNALQYHCNTKLSNTKTNSVSGHTKSSTPVTTTTTKQQQQQQQRIYPYQRSTSDTSLYPFESDTDEIVHSYRSSHYYIHPSQSKIRQRSSMDQSMLSNFYNNNNNTFTPYNNNNNNNNNNNKNASLLMSKASADSLPIVSRSNSTDEEDGSDHAQSKKLNSNRRTFWPRKLFSSQDSNSSRKSKNGQQMIHGVFGIPLEEVVNSSRISNSCELPAIAYRCIEYLEGKNAVKEEGLYRLSGSSVEINELRNRFNEMGDVDLLNSGEYHDVHAVAGLLKLWLRELPVNILTPDLATDFLTAVEYADKKQRIQELGRLISMLPLANYTLLRTLIAHLIHVVHNSEQNKMTIRNVGIVFSPTLGIPSAIFNLLLSEFENIFSTSGNSKVMTMTNANTNTDNNTAVITPEPTTSADRIKQKYLKAEERSNRNSMKYKNGIPFTLRNLENYIDEKKESKLLLLDDD